MRLQATEGHYLTENFNVQPGYRRFLQSIELAGSEEAGYWKEITQSEKEAIQLQASLFGNEGVSYEYLKKLEAVEETVPMCINEAGLTPAQALEMKRYFPDWAEILGTYAYAGFMLNFEGVLLEVVTPHTLSADISPAQQPMMLNVTAGQDGAEQPVPVVYFKPVADVVAEMSSSQTDEIEDGADVTAAEDTTAAESTTATGESTVVEETEQNNNNI